MGLSNIPYLNNDKQSLQCAKFSKSGVTLFNMSSAVLDGCNMHENSLKNLQKNYTSTDLCNSSVKKMRQRCEWLYQFSKGKSKLSQMQLFKNKGHLAFITLTLPSEQIHSDQTIKKECLDKFLLYSRRKYRLFNYVWKAELQGNGNIHFHIVTDTFIHKNSVKSLWNYCVNKLGYVDRFKSKHGHNEPNSTRIESIRKPEKISKYISKYVSKSTISEDWKPSELNKSRCKEMQSCLDDCGVEYTENDIKPILSGKKIGCSESLKNVADSYEFVDSLIDTECRKFMLKYPSKVVWLDECVILNIDWCSSVTEDLPNICKAYYQSYEKNYKYFKNEMEPPPSAKKTCPPAVNEFTDTIHLSHQKANNNNFNGILPFGWLSLPR